MQKSTALPIAILIFVIVSACCICGGLAFIFGMQYINSLPLTDILQNLDGSFGKGLQQNTPAATIDSRPIDDTAYTTLEMLQNTSVPVSDPIDIAARLLGIKDVPRTIPAPLVPLRIGDRQLFWVTNDDTLESTQVKAYLRYITDDIYFWVEDGVGFDLDDIESLVRVFDDKIIPINRKFFGDEWIPGVDNDPHIYVLYTRGLGQLVLGYFSAPDEFPPQVTQYANGHEMFVLSADNMALYGDEIRSTVAHEFQHMIHWYRDRNEESWITEGFSQLAEVLNGYSPPSHDYAYAEQPDTQINDWSTENTENSAHYGAAFLYMTYFLDRFGETITQALVSETENGMTSIDKVLETHKVTDPLTGEPIGADDVFADWATAFYLNDSSVSDGRYSLSLYPNPPSPDVQEVITHCPLETQTQSVHQYGIDYLEITCQGDYMFEFQGAQSVQLLPVDAYSGRFSFWSNQGDESNPTLTREFDLTGATGKVEMSYQTWYDIEKDWDYVYVEVSSNGEDWQILDTPSCTTYDPTGNSYGCGYTGITNGWVTESVDLSNYAGKTIWVRFDYITDTAVTTAGLLLDDVRVDAINYYTDFENGDDNWVADGFVRIENLLPQTFQVTHITMAGDTTVQRIDLSEDMDAKIPFSINSRNEKLVIIISGTTRFTKQQAIYSYTIYK